MFVEINVPAARKRLVTIGDEAPLIEATKLLDCHTDLVSCAIAMNSSAASSPRRM
jgi:hypothetical protein